MLNTKRCPMRELGRPAGEPERERRRHRDDCVDAPEPSTGPQAGKAGQQREPEKAECSARQVASVIARERVDAGDRSPIRRLAADQPSRPARLDGVVAVPGQRSHDMRLVTARRQLAHDAAHDVPRRRRVGVEVGAQADEAHQLSVRWYASTSAAPDAAKVKWVARSRPASMSSARRRSTSSNAPDHASTSSGSTIAADPATSRRAG